MKLRDRRRARSRAKRRIKAAKSNENSPLREFVYMDEISVFSLLASRIGAVATEFTETESSNLRGEASGKIAANSGLLKGEASSKISASSSSGSQVVRKAIVQSTFREFHEFCRDLFLVGRDQFAGAASSASDVKDLIANAKRGSDHIIPASEFDRGDIVEMEVELDADEIFRASAILSSLLDLMEEFPDVESQVDAQALRDVVAGSRLIDQMLAGLVPLRARVVDYALLEMEGVEYVVRRDALTKLNSHDGIVRDLYLVGVAEAEFFWRDLRRVLFSGSRFLVLSRIARDGLHETWTPVKLKDLLESVAPDLTASVDEIPAILDAMGSEGEAESSARLELVLREFVGALADRLELEIAVEVENRAVVNGLTASAITDTPAGVRESLVATTVELEQSLELSFDRSAVAQVRTATLLKVLGISNEAPDLEPQAETTRNGVEHRFLDCEIVAIYW